MGELIAQTETTNSPNRSIGAVSPEESSAVEHFRAPLVPSSVAERTMKQTVECLQAFTQTEQAVRREAMLSFLGAIQSNFQLQTVTQSPFVRERTP